MHCTSNLKQWVHFFEKGVKLCFLSFFMNIKKCIDKTDIVMYNKNIKGNNIFFTVTRK